MSLRVISGELKGRLLRTPPGRKVRPTQGHVRQVLFDIVDGGIVGGRVLDLFAGSGALGIEALSRGAAEAVFVERDPGALRCLRENLESFGLVSRGRVLAAPVAVGLRILEEWDGSFSWVLADPPYDAKMVDWVRRTARKGPGAVLDGKGTLVVEGTRRRDDPPVIAGLRRYRVHPVGETILEFYGWEGRDESQGDLPGDV